jgi:hypothetical protein
MKRLLFAGLIAVSLSVALPGCGGGQKYTSSAVPSKVLNEFHDMYPTATDVKWKNRDGLYEADFELGNQDLNASFTPDGDFIRSNM